MTAKYTPVKVEYINPFLAAAKNVFQTMLNCDIERGQPYLKNGVQPNHEISGVIGLSGRAVGTVVLSLDRDVALQATATLLGEPALELNADVVDTVGELTNMIAGNAKAQLEEFQMSISLPNVIMGRNHTVAFPSGVTPIGIPFDCQWGSVCVDVGLCVKNEVALEMAVAN